MKKFLIAVIAAIIIYVIFQYAYYFTGALYLPAGKINQPKFYAENGKIVEGDNEGNIIDDNFIIKGVNVGLGVPGSYPGEHDITEEQYDRWIRMIHNMGANTVRVYTVCGPEFYRSFYRYNTELEKKGETPIYLIHGVWFEDSLHNSEKTASDSEVKKAMDENGKEVIDVVHGRLKKYNRSDGTIINYFDDVSPWVIGYIYGVEWEPDFVTYTDIDEKNGEVEEEYKGTYLFTENGSVFEKFLAESGDRFIDYESTKYGSQKMLAFSNWPLIDPFEYGEKGESIFRKHASVDTEHIKYHRTFNGGLFASYHVYPYYPEYESSYEKYIKKLNLHHEMPVVISEFGIPSSRGMAAYEDNREKGRNQGRMTEDEQGKALVSMYDEIIRAGSSGGIVFIWQDEWFKRTWNTVAGVNLNRTAMWNDMQTNEQNFGMIAFDPINSCMLDGKTDDFNEDSRGENIHVKTDFRYLYILYEPKEGFKKNEKVLLPIDITPLSGSRKWEKTDGMFERESDFIIVIDGGDSRILVQERYDNMKALYSQKIKINYNQFFDPPAKNSKVFSEIMMPLYEYDYYMNGNEVSDKLYNSNSAGNYVLSEKYITGKLINGISDPASDRYNSLSDYYITDTTLEIRIPWQLINFSDPSSCKVHGDYYENYGVEDMSISEIYIGAGKESDFIKMEKIRISGWESKDIEYIERLKKSYWILENRWKEVTK